MPPSPNPPASLIMRVFGHARVLLPVVHPISEAAALDSIAVAAETGCPGVFLINQGMTIDAVLRLVMRVRQIHPGLWVGVNLLGLSPLEALRAALGACEGRIDGIWTDDALIDERSSRQPAAQAFLEFREQWPWHGCYFGGIAFKYRRAVPRRQLAQAARAAAPYMDVVCSSGPGTGQAVDVDKLARLRAGLAEGESLALASGVTAQNIAEFLPHAEAFLVGTGAERAFGVLDAAKLARLQDSIDAWLGASAAKRPGAG